MARKRKPLRRWISIFDVGCTHVRVGMRAAAAAAEVEGWICTAGGELCCGSGLSDIA